MIIFEVPDSSTQTPSVQHIGSTRGPNLLPKRLKNSLFNIPLSSANPSVPPLPQFHIPLSSTPKKPSVPHL